MRAAAKAPPIDALRMACATLSLDLAKPDDISPVADLQAAKMLTARFPTVIAAHARLSAGKQPIAPRADLPHAANFLYMVHGNEPDPIAAKAIDTYWVTVIDHGMNASTFAARVIASTRSDMVSAVTGAIGALKGPLHGGAPGPVLDMLKDIKSADRAEPWVRNELAAGRRIMGMGHHLVDCAVSGAHKDGLHLNGMMFDVRGCVARDNGGDGIGGMGGGWTLTGNRAVNNDGNGILVSGREVVDGGGNNGTGNRGLHQQRPAAQCEISGAPCRP